jgi:N utilization substance protein A
MDEDNKELEIVVPDNQLSLAIGKRGQNVRLAAKLTTWKIDIMSESSASARTAEAIFNLMIIPGMSETMAQNIFQSGFGSFKIVAQAQIEEIMTIAGYEDAAKAEKLIRDAKGVVEKYEKEGIPIPVSPQMQAMVKMQGDAKSQADARLKQEIEKLHGTVQPKADPSSDHKEEQ